MRTASGLAALVLAVPALATVPATFALMAYCGPAEARTPCGCVNNYAQLTNNNLRCYPFRGFPIAGTDTANMWGPDYCSIDTGVLGCWPSGGYGSGNAAVFHIIGNDLATEQYGKNFSVAVLPTSADTNGVPLIVGDSGAVDLVLFAKSQSG